MNDPTPVAAVDRAALLEAIVDSATQAIITIDEAQNIVLFNREAEAIFGCKAADALGKPLDRFIPARMREAHHRHIASFKGARGHGVRAMGGDRIVYGLRADGSEFPIDASISRIDTPCGALLTVILRDVTLRERDRAVLQRYADIVESSSDAIVSRTVDGRIVTWNAAAARIFGYTPAEAASMSIEQLYSPDTAEEQRNLMRRALNGEPIVNFETVRRRKDGTDVNVAVTISLVRDRDGQVRGASAIFRDITERMRMERELRTTLALQKQAETALRESRDSLRELSSALQTIREDEKTRIARELHDELGQALTALKMDAAAVAGEIGPAGEAVLKRVESMKQLIDSTIISLRRISADLRPMMLDNLGLTPTLEWLARDFATRTGIHVELDIPVEDLGVEGDAATAIFRIVQEGLTNVARHSGATEVAVRVIRSNGNVVVRVHDNGRGIGEADARKPRSFGLLGMRERAYVLGGDLKAERVPQGGTLIEAVIPAFGTVEGKSS